MDELTRPATAMGSPLKKRALSSEEGAPEDTYIVPATHAQLERDSNPMHATHVKLVRRVLHPKQGA